MVYMQCFFGFPTFFHTLKALYMERIIRRKRENKNNSINNKNQKKMGKLVEGLKIAAYVAEVVMASTVIIELVGSKCGGRAKVKAASVETGAGEAKDTE